MTTPRWSTKLSYVMLALLASIILYGCGASSLGPQEPLLPPVEGDAKFSDRFELEEEPHFFYDLFGKELLEGNEVHHYKEEKAFDEHGELYIGRTGQLDSERFTAQLDRTVLTEDSFRGRHTEFAIGDNMRIKPETLFPNRYAIYKTEFDGLRWDISFSRERHMFTLLSSRISNPSQIAETAADLAPTFGRRNGPNEDAAGEIGYDVRHIENARLIGIRAQGLLGDVFRVGFTWLNLHKEHPERIENPLMGTVPNTPPTHLIILFKDDSPEDNSFTNDNIPQFFYDEATYDEEKDYNLEKEQEQGGVGVAFKKMTVKVVTQALDAEGKLGKEQTKTFDVFATEEETTFIPSGVPVEDLTIKDEHWSDDGTWLIAEGFDAIKCEVDIREKGIDPRTVKSMEIVMDVAGDYYIDVYGYSRQNAPFLDADGAPIGDPMLYEWIKDEDGLIRMPYRDTITRPGNYGQTSDYTDNREAQKNKPSTWEGDGKPTKVKYQYGAARAGVIYGIDLEGTLFETHIRAQYSINAKYKQYPTVSEDQIGFSERAKVEDALLYMEYLEMGPEGVRDVQWQEKYGEETPPPDPMLDPEGVPLFLYNEDGTDYEDESWNRQPLTYSDVDGETFSAKLNGDPNDDGEMGQEVAWFISLKHRFGKLLLEEAFYHVDPGYTTTYRNFGANTDRDETYSIERTPESGAEASPFDEEDYQLIEDDDDDDDWPDSEDFDGVLPEADDRDKNGILDYQEDFLIFDADPPIFGDLIDLNNNGIVDALEDDYEPEYEYGINIKGFHIAGTYDILDNMTLKLGWLRESQISSSRKNHSRYLHLIYDRDIPDFGTIRFQDRFVKVEDDIPDYARTMRQGETEPIEVADMLDYYNATVNTSTLRFIYTAIPGLTLESSILYIYRKQNQPDDEDAICLDNPDSPRSERIDFMVPEVQVRESGDKREFPFYPDYGYSYPDQAQIFEDETLFDPANWLAREYKDKTIKQRTIILKGRYEIALGNLPILDKVGEDITITPMFKYIWVNNIDREDDDPMYWPAEQETIDKLSGFFKQYEEDGMIVPALQSLAFNPLIYDTATTNEVREYLRLNTKSREDVLGVRLDYLFTQRMNILAGLQWRKFVNKDEEFQSYLDFLRIYKDDETIGDNLELFRANRKSRIFELQIINRGEWLGFNIVILAGYRRHTDLLRNHTANTTFVRALMGF